MPKNVAFEKFQKEVRKQGCSANREASLWCLKKVKDNHATKKGSTDWGAVFYHLKMLKHLLTQYCEERGYQLFLGELLQLHFYSDSLLDFEYLVDSQLKKHDLPPPVTGTLIERLLERKSYQLALKLTNHALATSQPGIFEELVQMRGQINRQISREYYERQQQRSKDMEREKNSQLVEVKEYRLTLDDLESKLKEAEGDYFTRSSFEALLS